MIVWRKFHISPFDAPLRQTCSQILREVLTYSFKNPQMHREPRKSKKGIELVVVYHLVT